MIEVDSFRQALFWFHDLVHKTYGMETLAILADVRRLVRTSVGLRMGPLGHYVILVLHNMTISLRPSMCINGSRSAAVDRRPLATTSTLNPAITSHESHSPVLHQAWLSTLLCT